MDGIAPLPQSVYFPFHFLSPAAIQATRYSESIGRDENWGAIVSVSLLNPFTPKSDQFQISPAASPEYYITQYGELGFSLLTKMKDD